MAEWTTDFLRELIDERDRLYKERHDSVRRELDAANAAHKQALDKAFEAAQSEQSTISEQLNSIRELNLTMERRISLLEAGRNQDSGRREPVQDVMKWLGALIIAALAWAAGHLIGK